MVPIHFIFLKDVDAECVIHSQEKQYRIYLFDNINNITDEIFKTFSQHIKIF